MFYPLLQITWKHLTIMLHARDIRCRTKRIRLALNGKIRVFLMIKFVHFRLPSQNVWNMMYKKSHLSHLVPIWPTFDPNLAGLVCVLNFDYNLPSRNLNVKKWPKIVNISQKIVNEIFCEKMTIFGNFVEKMLSFWQFFDIQISGG